MKVTFYGSIAMAAIAAQTAKADGIFDDEPDSYAQLYENAADYADTEATELMELESGDEGESLPDNWAELDEDEYEDGLDLAEIEGAPKGCNPKKAQPKAGKKAKIDNMKNQAKAKIVAAKDKAKKKVDGRKKAVDDRKKRVAIRKAQIAKKVRAQRAAVQLRKK